MPVGTWYPLQGLMPLRDNPPSAVGAGLIPPAGGPIGSGGPFAQGQAFTLTNNPAQPQIFTLTITGGASGGTGYFIYNDGQGANSGLANASTGGITANASTTFPTAAQLQAALCGPPGSPGGAYPLWNGNLTVTGSVGGPYTITFNNLCVAKSIGGLLQFFFYTTSGGVPVGTVTVAQQGSCGYGDVNIFNYNTTNRVDAVLINSVALDGVGGEIVDLAGDVGQASGGQGFFIHGYFSLDTTNFPQGCVIGNWGPSVPSRFTVTQGVWGTAAGLEVIMQ